MDKITAVISTAIIIGLIIWWFFGKRTGAAVIARREGDRQIVEITVEGGYKPAVVQLEKGVPTDLVFIRKDPSACFEEVVLPDFGASTHLPVNQPYTISINPDKSGEFKYACGMNMFFGKVVVK
jgi:plastocyanin domain-containing protein